METNNLNVLNEKISAGRFHSEVKRKFRSLGKPNMEFQRLSAPVPKMEKQSSFGKFRAFLSTEKSKIDNSMAPLKAHIAYTIANRDLKNPGWRV